MRTIMCVSNGRGEQRSIQLTLWPVVTVMRDIAAIEAVFIIINSLPQEDA